MAADMNVVRNTYNRAKPIVMDLVTKFFQNLIEADPAISKIIENVDIKATKKLFAEYLDSSIKNIDNLDALAESLEGVGDQLSAVEFEDRFYKFARSSFLDALAYFFGGDWNTDYAKNWGKAIDRVLVEIAGDYVLEGTMSSTLPHLEEAPMHNLPEVPAAPIPAIPKTETRSVSLGENESSSISPSETTEKIAERENDSSAIPSITIDEDKLNPIQPENSDQIQESPSEDKTLATTEAEENVISIEDKKEGSSAFDGIDISQFMPTEFELPAALKEKIDEHAAKLVKEAVEKEFKKAIEKQMGEYLSGNSLEQNFKKTS